MDEVYEIPTVPDGFTLIDPNEDLKDGDLIHDLNTGSWVPATPKTVRDGRAAIRSRSSRLNLP